MIFIKKRLLLLSVIFLSFFSNAKEYKNNFIVNGVEHKVSIIITQGKPGDSRRAMITASETTSEKKIWSLIDYIDDCDLDISLSLLPGSFEVLPGTDGSIVLFAYEIGCFGDISPATVKYFAYKNGVKYSLRGEEKIVTPNGVIDDKVTPVPDANLKKDNILYNYMKIRWKEISTVKWE